METLYQVIAGVTAAVGMFGAMLLRARKAASTARALSQAWTAPGCCGAAPAQPAAPALPPPPRPLGQRIATLLDRWDYLRTRREWRYGARWILLLGEAGAGKTSALASVPANAVLAPDAEQLALAVAGTRWQFHPQGVLIDPDGHLPAAPAGSSDAQAWRQVLDRIDALRPERPLDGLMLVISARSLLTAGADQRHALAVQAATQLKQIQRRFEFMLPVYVTIGEADAVPGFSAFWRVQAPARQTEMFGWSASQTDDADPQAWADSAFDMLGGRLRTLQVEAAAARGQLDDVDQFFLFPRHFQQLRAPLKAWLAVVFQESAWQAGFRCRGIYFTGSVAADGDDSGAVRGDVAFVADLITHKVLAEPHLARPTRQGIWSRNKLIRTVQVAAVLAYCGLLAALGAATPKLERQVDALALALTQLKAVPPVTSTDSPCVSRERVVALLAQVARIDGATAYAAIPASWFDRHLSQRTENAITTQALQGVVMPALACQLRLRAEALAMDSDAVPAATPDSGSAAIVAQSRQALFGYLQSVRALELNLERYNQLAGLVEQPDGATLARMLSDLTVYGYGGAAPPLLPQPAALRHLRYTADPRLPADMRAAFAAHLAQRAAALRQTLDQELASGADLLASLEREQPDILDHTRHFSWWLKWVRTDWLSATPALNPCEDIRGHLDTDVSDLLGHYPVQYRPYQDALRRQSIRFNLASCYQPARQSLAAMRLAPHDPLFMPSSQGLRINPGLAKEADGMDALMALSFMQLPPAGEFVCQASVPGWQAAQIAQAASYARVYQAYAKAQGLPAPGGAAAPLYDRLARQQLELAMNSAMAGAQLPEVGGMAGARYQAGAAALDDQQISQQSTALAATLAPMLGVLQTYKDLGFASRLKVSECARKYATDQLARIATLARTSSLYNPKPMLQGATFYDLGGTSATKDYLARQATRGQVLAGYAVPFVNLLQGTSVLNDAQKTDEQSTAYWSNTVDEVNRYVQFKDPNGQVALLEQLFLKQLSGLGADNCRQVLVPAAVDPGHDLFSQRRQRLEEDAGNLCTDRRNALALSTYQDLALRFNGELAGHYPFSELKADELSLSTVQAFFNDYAAQRVALRKAVADMKGKYWTDVGHFLDQLDAALALFSGTLVGTDQPQPIKLGVTFRAAPADSPGSEQIVTWGLSSGANVTGFPNRPTTLDWAYGQPIVLDLAWANRSPWVPIASAAQPDLRTEGASASFAAGGNWALLRMIDAHRASSAPASQTDLRQVLLEYKVPVTPATTPPGKLSTGMARLFIGLKLTALDPKTKLPVALPPPRMPTSAP